MRVNESRPRNPVRGSGLSVLIPTAGMEICRLYAVGSLLFLIPGSPPYPFAALAAVLTAGTLLGRFLSFVSGRRITSVLVNIFLCGLCVFLLARSYSGYVFWLTACAAGFFFFRGVNLGARGVSHSLTVTRYDIGIGVFFFMFLLRMLFNEIDPLALRIVGAYFLFSILAMAASRSWEKDELFTGSRPAVSHVVPFIAVFFIAASAIVLLYPLLTQAAGGVYVFLRDNSGPVLNFLAAIIRFLFGQGHRLRFDPSSSTQTDGREVIIAENSEPGILFRIIGVIFIIIGIVVVLFLLIITVRALVRYLSGRSGPQDGEGVFATLLRLLRIVWNKLIGAVRSLVILRLLQHRPLAGIAQEAFGQLCRWGRISGIPRHVSETPAEYACRLGARFPRFPAVSSAAAVLARALDEELYGEYPSTNKTCSLIKAALKELANPSLFPARISSHFSLRRR